MTPQTTFPLVGTPYNPGPAGMDGYMSPDRSTPAAAGAKVGITVLGTTRNEIEAFRRCWSVWSRQKVPKWLRPEFLVLDDGSDDGIRDEVVALRKAKARIRWASFRAPGNKTERSCSLLWNAAIRQLVKTPLVMIGFWDRVPGGFRHLALLVEPHRTMAGIATSPTSRHIGGSSSEVSMSPEQLGARLALVDWQEDPTRLEQVAGPLGGHCRAPNATESSGLVIPVAELVAVGGFDERYQSRAGYVNVTMYRRLLATGLVVWHPADPEANNYHLSHPCPVGRKKQDTFTLLRETAVVVNGGPGGEWGRLEPLEVIG